MKSDLDRLMTEANLDALVILGDEAPNPYRDYLTNRAKANGSIFKKRNESPIFVIGSAMEREEAAHSGLSIYTNFNFRDPEMQDKYGNAVLLCNILRKLEITGRVAFCGVADINRTLAQVALLKDCLPDVEVVVGPEGTHIFDQALLTKDDNEIAELTKAGHLANQIVRETWDFISGHSSRGHYVYNSEGQPLTIGKVKQFVNRRQLDLGLEEPGGVIFAQGYDAAIPHSQGTDTDVIELGKSIVFDYFPRLMDSGYYHDMTRTWCIGYAPPEVQTTYDQVLEIFQQAKNSVKVGEATSVCEIMTLDYFEAKGHPTTRSQPGTTTGYVHTLGHGLGLNIHEAPGLRASSKEIIRPRTMFTIEPGLYYPDRGYGVRIEDTVYFDDNNVLHDLTDMPYDLVLPLKG